MQLLGCYYAVAEFFFIVLNFRADYSVLICGCYGVLVVVIGL